ncbi:MAG: hypothetical protein KJ767_02990 [Nanoarchaeota archaeon]|nr:hypothetical protein [Nanoarchaeota archaeon]
MKIGKNPKELRKAISIALVLILIINLVLFAFRVIHALQFWLIIVVSFIVSLFLPKVGSK